MKMTQYVKVPQLRQIIDRKEDCETTLHNIKSLIGLSEESSPPSDTQKLKLVPPGSPRDGGTSTEPPSVKSNHENIEIVLKDFSNNEKNDGRAILEYINNATSISWNPETFEIVIDNDVVKFTDIRLLLKAIVGNSTATLPVGLCLFIEKLIELKLPFSHYRGGNALALRNNLLKILGSKEQSSDGKVADTDPETTNELSPSTELPRKRKREVDEVDEMSGKREKIEDSASAPLLPDERFKGLRRSARLKKEIQDVWKSNTRRKK